VKSLLAAGYRMTAPIAAALGRIDALPELLKAASADEVQRAFRLAAINDQTEAGRNALDAGAEPNQARPVHTHCFAMQQAVLHDDLALMDLLLSRGARADMPDTLWGSAPLGWAVHEKKPRTRAFLEQHLKQQAEG